MPRVGPDYRGAFNPDRRDRRFPSWYLVATVDRMIPPDAQRAMSKGAGSTVVEVKGSHAVYESQPRAVADLIAKAVNGVGVATR